LAFGVEIDKDVVRRILSVHYRPESDAGGPGHGLSSTLILGGLHHEYRLEKEAAFELLHSV
jgi:hypothetical protein